MTVVAPDSEAAEDHPVPAATSTATGRRRTDLLVAVASLALALYLTNGLWQHPYHHVVRYNTGDQAFFEWVLAYGTELLRNGGDPFFTALLNAPFGVNLAANTSVTVYAILFAPLTMLAGPQVTFVTVLTLNLAGAGFAWYLFFGRWVARNRAAAALGGLFCGFAPGFVSHANGHLNWTAGWIAPVVLWQLLKLRERGRWLRNGAILGLLIGICFLIAAEALFCTALACGVFVISWALAPASRAAARAGWRTMLAGLGVTAAVAGLLLAYPLWMHFAGPQTFKGTGFNQRAFAEDLAAFFAYSDRTLAGLIGLSADLAPNPTEETTFFGLPLVVLTIVSMVVLWRRADASRRATLRAVAIVGGLFFVISLGPRLMVFGWTSHIPLPYALLQRLPLFDSALPLRFALVLVGVIGVILAMVADELLDEDRMPLPAKPALAAGLALSLIPLFPLPVITADRAPEPRFIANRTWERYVPAGGVLSALPFASNLSADGQRWQAYTMARGGRQFRMPDGYFLGPDVGGAGEKGRMGAPFRHTDWLFLRASLYGYVPMVDNWDRKMAREDFRYWGVDAIFLPKKLTGPDGTMLLRAAVERTAIDLLGPPMEVDDVLVWQIRQGLDPADRT